MEATFQHDRNCKHGNDAKYKVRSGHWFRLAETHPLVGSQCAACNGRFEPGDTLAMVPIGPGADKEQRRKAVKGEPYDSIAAILHTGCSGLYIQPSDVVA